MSRYCMCNVCGHRMKKIDDDTYYCPWCAASEAEGEDDYDGETLSVWEAAEI